MSSIQETIENSMMNDDAKKFMLARGLFANEYCKSKGWNKNPDDLTFEQIFEIREQEGWINPCIM